MNEKERKDFNNLTMAEKKKYLEEREKGFNHQGAFRKAKNIYNK